MAQTIGDGPNRGKSAAPPRRLPKPAPSSKRSAAPASRSQDRDTTPRGRGPAVRDERREEQKQFFQVTPARTPVFDVERRTDPSLTKLFEREQPKVDVVPQKRASVEIAPKQDSPWVLDLDAKPDPGTLNQIFRRTDNNAQIVQNVADQYNVKAKIGQRETKRIAREAADRSESAAPLTAEQWEKFTPLQQAAAQANADLAAAIQRDFDTQSKHKSTPEKFDRYQARVKDLFGEDGSVGFKGLEYAPNTVAFLDSRGIDAKDLAGRSLDDLVSGDSLVDTDTVNALHEKQPEWDKMKTPFGEATTRGPADRRGQNIAFAQQLAQGQLAYQEEIAKTLQRGDRLLTDITSPATNKEAGESYGALQAPTRMRLPDVQPQTLAQFDMYLEALARPDSPVDQALEAISLDLQQRGASEKEMEQVHQALLETTRQAMTGEGRWFDGIDFEMRNPQEVAQALGTPLLKRQATTSTEGAR